MTKKEFMDKWLIIDPYHYDVVGEERRFMKDLNKVVKQETNHLTAGITNAIFELQQAYKRKEKEK